MNNLANRLKLKRKEKKLPRPSLAALAGVSTSAIQKYEEGHAKPGNEVLKLLAKALGVTSEWLLNGTTSRGIVPVIEWNDAAKWHSISKNKTEDKSPENYLYSPDPGIDAENIFALKIKDDSMMSLSKSFNKDGYIVVSTEHEVKSGCFVVCCKRGQQEAIFRQYIISNGRGFLKPLNPQWPSDEFLDDIRIIGVVIQEQMILIA